MVLPAPHRPLDVFPLGTLIAPTQEKDQCFTALPVVHPVAGTEGDPQFPDTIATELVVPEVPLPEAIDAPQESGVHTGVLQPINPFLVEIMAVSGEIVG